MLPIEKMGHALGRSGCREAKKKERNGRWEVRVDLEKSMKECWEMLEAWERKKEGMGKRKSIHLQWGCRGQKGSKESGSSWWDSGFGREAELICRRPGLKEQD